jgi:hypothetical protein
MHINYGTFIPILNAIMYRVAKEYMTHMKIQYKTTHTLQAIQISC